MADEEEFETLCRELEESSSGSVGEDAGDSTCGSRDRNSSTVLDEIDEFLEESQGSVLLRSKSDLEKQEDNDLLRDEDQEKKLNGETEEESKKSHSDCNDVTNLLLEEEKCIDTDQACSVRPGDSEGLDYSLLDREEWEEDREESTVTDILSQLLDNEEDVVTETIDVTKQELQKVTRGMIEQRYYSQLETVWRKYSEDPGVGDIPPIHMISPPRIFRDKKGEINDFETVEEYIDSNHPLRGGVYRDVFTDILRMEEKDRRKKYREGSTAQDLVALSRPSRRRMTREARGNKEQRCPVSDGEVEIGRVKAVLVEMYQNSIHPDIEEAEDVRMTVFQKALKEKLKCENPVSCQCRRRICICSSGTGKRKRSQADQGGAGRAAGSWAGESAGEWRSYSLHSPPREGRIPSYYSGLQPVACSATEDGGWDSDLLEEY